MPPATRFQVAGAPTNRTRERRAASDLYKQDGLVGSHVIMLGNDDSSSSAALEALHAYPGGLQVGVGINSTMLSHIDEGASHVIVTSYVFSDGQMNVERLKDLDKQIGKERLVLDLSCRKKAMDALNQIQDAATVEEKSKLAVGR